MPPNRTAKKRYKRVATTHERAESDQESNTTTTEDLARTMKRDKDIRVAGKRKDLKDGYEREVSAVEEEIEKVAQEEDVKLATLHEDQKTRLAALVKRRCDIEFEIINHIHVLEQAYGSAINELTAALKGKIEDIEEVLEAASKEKGEQIGLRTQG